MSGAVPCPLLLSFSPPALPALPWVSSWRGPLRPSHPCILPIPLCSHAHLFLSCSRHSIRALSRTARRADADTRPARADQCGSHQRNAGQPYRPLRMIWYAAHRSHGIPCSCRRVVWSIHREQCNLCISHSHRDSARPHPTGVINRSYKSHSTLIHTSLIHAEQRRNEATTFRAWD